MAGFIDTTDKIVTQTRMGNIEQQYSSPDAVVMATMDFKSAYAAFIEELYTKKIAVAGNGEVVTLVKHDAYSAPIQKGDQRIVLYETWKLVKDLKATFKRIVAGIVFKG